MKKLEDKTNLTRIDYFIYYKELKKESEEVDRLLDENKLYLTKLESGIQEKNYEIKQLTKDYDEVSKLLTIKIRENERMTKEITKLNNKINKLQDQYEKQKQNVDKLNYEIGKKNDELCVLNDRLEFCRSHRRAPDIEELKAYTYKEDEVTKRIRRQNVS